MLDGPDGMPCWIYYGVHPGGTAARCVTRCVQLLRPEGRQHSKGDEGGGAPWSSVVETREHYRLIAIPHYWKGVKKIHYTFANRQQCCAQSQTLARPFGETSKLVASLAALLAQPLEFLPPQHVMSQGARLVVCRQDRKCSDRPTGPQGREGAVINAPHNIV
jgi:hypothetical protein